MRILRVLRGVKSARAMAHFVVARRTESAFFASAILALLLVVCCSIAVLEFEAPAGTSRPVRTQCGARSRP